MATSSQFSDIQLNSTADDALRVLSEAGDQALALIDAWIESANAGAVQEIAERGSGPARKNARRALNVLKARGVAIPERRRVPRAAEAPNESPQAWLLAPDPSGTWLLVIARRLPTAAYRSSFVFLSDDTAVLEIQVRELSQSRLQEAMRGALRGQAYEPVKAPVAWARQVIGAARQSQRGRGMLEPLGFKSAADLLEPLPAEPQNHPFDDEGFALAEEDARQMAVDSGKLHQLPEFRPWLPTRSAISEMLVKIGERLRPGETPESELLKQYVKEEVAAATDRYFTPERRAQLVTRMKHSGLSVLARDGEEKALLLAAAIEVISRAGLITHPPRDIPFLLGFFEKALAFSIAENQGQLRVPVRQAPAGAGASASEPELPSA